MAQTILVRDALWRVSTLLADVSPQFARHPEKELVQWMMDGEGAITKYLPMAASRVDAIKLRPGTLQTIESIAAADCKPGNGTTPAVSIKGRQFMRPFRNMGTDGLTPGRVVRMIERDVLDAQDPNWHAGTKSKTVHEVVFDPTYPRYFSTYPGVHATIAVWLEIGYTADPLAIPNTGTPGSELYLAGGASTQTITIDDEFLEDLIDYIVARANLKDSKYAEPAKAVFHTNRFLNSLNTKVAAATGTNPNFTALPGVSAPGAPA